MMLATSPWESSVPPQSGATNTFEPLEAEQLDPWARLVGDRLGLAFPRDRRQPLRRALSARMRATQCVDLAAYLELLNAMPWEWDGLIDALTVRETEFFREPQTFDAISGWILPELLHERAQSGRLAARIWSAGCSEGDEVYSLAMLARECLDEPDAWDMRVAGSDVSAKAIEAAATGRYPTQRVRRVPARLRERYFECETGTDTVRVRPELRALTRFRQFNLVGRYWPMAAQDLVVCQNVLFYLRPAAQTLVAERLYRSLAPGSYLIVGVAEAPTEPLFGTVRPIVIDGARVYRRS
jgi:chemotaxis methyl-accepting protein methylase